MAVTEDGIIQCDRCNKKYKHDIHASLIQEANDAFNDGWYVHEHRKHYLCADCHHSVVDKWYYVDRGYENL